MTEIAIRNPLLAVPTDAEATDWLARIDSARHALDAIEDVTEAKNVADMATAAIAYGHVIKSRDAANYATELRIWAERRVGKLLNDAGETTKSVSEMFDVGRASARRWKYLATVAEEQLRAAIDDVKADRDLTVQAVVLRLNHRVAVKIEAGIYRLPDDSLMIRWTQNGYNRSKRLQHTSVDRARHTLRAARGTVAPADSQKGSPDLRAAYSNIRRVLAGLENARAVVAPEARPLVEEVMANLHSAEDLIAKAITANEVASPGMP